MGGLTTFAYVVEQVVGSWACCVNRVAYCVPRLMTLQNLVFLFFKRSLIIIGEPRILFALEPTWSFVGIRMGRALMFMFKVMFACLFFCFFFWDYLGPWMCLLLCLMYTFAMKWNICLNKLQTHTYKKHIFLEKSKYSSCHTWLISRLFKYTVSNNDVRSSSSLFKEWFLHLDPTWNWCWEPRLGSSLQHWLIYILSFF